jgi:hypothetical protein
MFSESGIINFVIQSYDVQKVVISNRNNFVHPKKLLKLHRDADFSCQLVSRLIFVGLERESVLLSTARYIYGLIHRQS